MKAIEEPARRTSLLALAVLATFLGTAFWFLSRSPTPVESTPSLVERHARTHGLDPDLVRAVIHAESGGRPGAVSPAGAVGLMQIMPGTAAAVAEKLGLPSPSRRDLFDPDVNIRIGTFYLAQMREDFGDDHLALGAYNAGPANVRRWRKKHPGAPGPEVIRRAGFAETRHFVKRVMAEWRRARGR